MMPVNVPPPIDPELSFLHYTHARGLFENPQPREEGC
jgi:hypothetical protein